MSGFWVDAWQLRMKTEFPSLSHRESGWYWSPGQWPVNRSNMRSFLIMFSKWLLVSFHLPADRNIDMVAVVDCGIINYLSGLRPRFLARSFENPRSVLSYRSFSIMLIKWLTVGSKITSLWGLVTRKTKCVMRGLRLSTALLPECGGRLDTEFIRGAII